jgi:acyl-CoA reductase-like NAD-dependent aldehyde dehydrogenase
MIIILTIDPSTLAEVARVSNMGKVETIDAINAATDAFASWRHTSSHVRIKNTL